MVICESLRPEGTCAIQFLVSRVTAPPMLGDSAANADRSSGVIGEGLIVFVLASSCVGRPRRGPGRECSLGGQAPGANVAPSYENEEIGEAESLIGCRGQPGALEDVLGGGAALLPEGGQALIGSAHSG
jgi:hypothetical protein